MINYYLLTKPGIILGNLITVAAGFLLASKGSIDFWLFFATVIGLTLIIASACVFNNYINRQTDKKMERTKNRALAVGLISDRNAILFGLCLGIFGHLILLLYTNFLTVLVSALGFFVYVLVYSIWKCRTVYGTAIGSIAGATPPVIGYCAASNHFDMGALLLFIIMILWQMPHFFSIALYHLDDYAAAKIPVLPVVRGLLRTQIHMAIYIVGFILTAALLTFFNYTGYVFLIVVTSIGLAWLAFCLKELTNNNNERWGQNMFRISLVMIVASCFLMSLDGA